MKTFKFGFKVRELPSSESQAVTAKETEEYLMKKLKKSLGMCKDTMWQLAGHFSRTDRVTDAVNIILALLTLSENDEERASCFLALGGNTEKTNDYAKAAEYYQEAFLLKSSHKHSWYFTNNNLGYCLNQLQRFEEAKNYFLTAIKTDPTRSNAYKNLGLCFQGLGEYIKSAKCFIAAIKADASDSRPLNHLKDLLREHPELKVDFPGLEENLNSCEKVVELARKMQPDFDAYWKELRRQFN
jgi:tetratricopeptide (TPR) repeat protein